MAHFLFIDVDGYCPKGVSALEVVRPGAEGFRARELGWALVAANICASGVVHFSDKKAARKLSARDPSVAVAQRMHRLPLNPRKGAYGKGALVVDSARLLAVIRALYEVALAAESPPPLVAIVHKGGPEGAWARLAAPRAPVIDLNNLGCPRVEVLGSMGGLRPRGPAPACPYHATREVTHCPLNELWLMMGWVARKAPAQAPKGPPKATL